MTLGRRGRMSQVRRIVVKVGSSSLTNRANMLNRRILRKIVDEVVVLRHRGVEVAIVTSGAVVAGMGRLGLESRPTAISDLQAVAAVGQNLLMHTYETLFRRYGVPVGQVLLTAGDVLDERRRYLNLQNTFRRLFAFGAVPVINENDSVAVAELRRQIGENDMLAAYVGNLVRAQLLVILSDIEGVYAGYRSSRSRGELISEIQYGDGRLDGLVGEAKSSHGRGGIRTKIEAARLLMACGEMTAVAHASRHSLVDLLDGERLGTLFLPGPRRLKSRHRWIAFAMPCRGSVIVDRGAENALLEGDCSLLPAGVVDWRGSFCAGDMVTIANEEAVELGRGLCRYSTGEIARIQGLNSTAISRMLGRTACEVVHRDDFVVLRPTLSGT